MLPLFQKAILLQYNVSLQQRQGQPQASEMIAAVNRLWSIIASEEEWIVSITVDMLFHRCNIFVYNDILFCRFYGIPISYMNVQGHYSILTL